MSEDKIPPKIRQLEKLHREIRQVIERSGSNYNRERGSKVTHRPLAVTQVAWIMAIVFGYYFSRSTLYKYMDYLEEQSDQD